MSLFIIYSFCSCDDSKQKNFDDDVFPSTYQMWGMIGTILTTVACWIFYSKLKIKRKRLHELERYHYARTLAVGQRRH